ncbi:MAG: NUDIX domain-containing protein [Caldilineaceae bacterium]
MQEIHRYRAAGGVVIHAEQMLLLDRPRRQEIRLPKGHIEPGETPEATALREVAEESGYNDLKIVTALGSQVVEFDHQGRHVIRMEYYFLMDLVSEQQIERDQHDADQFHVRWTPLAQAVEQLTFAPEQAVARQAIEAAKKRA